MEKPEHWAQQMKSIWNFDEYEWNGYLRVGAAAVTRDEPWRWRGITTVTDESRRWRMNHDGDMRSRFWSQERNESALLPFGSIWVQLIILFFKTVQLITYPQNTIQFWTFIHWFSLISVQFSSVQFLVFLPTPSSNGPSGCVGAMWGIYYRWL